MVEPLRIAIVTDSVYPFRIGGKEQRHFEIAKAVATRGAQVDVYTMKYWEGSRDQVIRGIRFHAICRDLPLYARGRRSIYQGIRFGLSCIHLATVRFDVLDVDATPVFPVLIAWLICKLLRRTLVVTCHEAWTQKYWRDYAGHVVGMLGSATSRIALRLPRQVIAVSVPTADGLEQILGQRERIVVVENAVDHQEIQSSSPLGPSLDLLYSGQLLPHKRIEIALLAVRILRDRGIKCNLTIAGRGPEELRLRDLCGHLGLNDCVRFRPPWIERCDYLSALKSAKVCVMPSVREGFGIGVLEAVTAGTPTIVTSAEQNASTYHVRDGITGSVVRPDAHAFASAIEYWLCAPISPQPFKSCRRDWDDCGSEMLRIYGSRESSPGSLDSRTAGFR